MRAAPVSAEYHGVAMFHDTNPNLVLLRRPQIGLPNGDPLSGAAPDPDADGWRRMLDESMSYRRSANEDMRAEVEKNRGWPPDLISLAEP